MLKKIKNFIAACFIWVGIKGMSLFYRKEIKALEETFKANKEKDIKNICDNVIKEAQSLPASQKAMLDEYARLQNEILKVFVLFTKEIQKVNGPEMDGLGGIWQTTTVGLNKTLTLAFSHKDDDKIKQHLYLLEKELQIAIDTNQEILGTKVGGGFGYSGPMGHA